MSTISSVELFNTNIEEPSGLSGIIEEVFPSEPWQAISRVNPSILRGIPPIFLYTESRLDDGRVSSFSIYGGGGESSTIMNHLGTRDVINTSLRYFSSGTRGELLSAFCQIVFCLDALVCIEEGVFENVIPYSELRREFKEEGRRFSTTYKKINYLRKDKRVIRSSTESYLMKASGIRNVLAHQFLPDDRFGVPAKDLKKYGSIEKALELIFNAAWINLLVDYNPKQIAIAKWLQSNNARQPYPRTRE